jgi:hypothetical protein
MSMKDTLTRFAQGIVDGSSRVAIINILSAIFDRATSKQLNTAALVIKAGASALVKTGAAACHAIAGGALRSIAAATDMAALSGTTVNATFNVYTHMIDSAGTLTTVMGTAGATLAAVKFPDIPSGKSVIGFTIINPTGTGDFVGGTTAIDDATVVPNAVHVSVIGAFDPSIKVS